MVPEGKTRVAITVDDDLLARIDDWCGEHGLTRSGFFVYLAEVALSDSDGSDIAERLLNSIVRKLLKVAADDEIAGRLRMLEQLDRTLSIA